MKTKLLFLMLFALLLVPAGCGGGDADLPPQEYTANSITVNVPGGWEASYGENEQQILLASPGEEYVTGIQILATGPATAQEFAALMSSELDGTTPIASPLYGEYFFDATIMGYPAHINILTVDGYSLVLVEIGDYKKFAQPVSGIVKSMKSSKPEFQKVIDAIKY